MFCSQLVDLFLLWCLFHVHLDFHTRWTGACSSIIHNAKSFVQYIKDFGILCLREENGTQKIREWERRRWQKTSNSSLYTKLWNNEETLQMKSLEIGIVKKYHKIYVSIQTNKQNLSMGTTSGMSLRTFWRERIEFFLLIQLSTWHRIHTHNANDTLSGIVNGIGSSICGNEIIFYLPINWFGCLFHYILFIYVVRIFVCVSFENNKSTIELNTKKTNSGTQMIVETETNILKFVRLL